MGSSNEQKLSPINNFNSKVFVNSGPIDGNPQPFIVKTVCETAMWKDGHTDYDNDTGVIIITGPAK
jgi:hypothetical protein